MSSTVAHGRTLERAYRRHQGRREARDWAGLAACFSEDARYFDPIFGWCEGREAIREFLEGAMAGLTERIFSEVWHIAEGDRVVCYWQCTLAGAEQVTPEKLYHEQATPDDLYHGMSALRYAGDGLFCEQMDVYDREQARGSRRRAAEFSAR